MKLQNLKLKCKNYNLIVGDTGFEPVTPALSRQCSEPTELITRSLNIAIIYFSINLNKWIKDKIN